MFNAYVIVLAWLYTPTSFRGLRRPDGDGGRGDVEAEVMGAFHDRRDDDKAGAYRDDDGGSDDDEGGVQLSEIDIITNARAALGSDEDGGSSGDDDGAGALAMR